MENDIRCACLGCLGNRRYMEKRQQTQRLAFRFFQEYAESGDWFTKADLMERTGWAQSSVKAYISKIWKGYLSSKGSGSAVQYKVRPEFLRVTEKEFFKSFTQKRLVVPVYQRSKHEVVVQFEFLLPLTKEDSLRRSLDDLFYRETLEARIHEIGLAQIERVIERDDETDKAYVQKVLNVVSSYFGGYSVSHVQGRFRASELSTRTDAVKAMVNGDLYLIDETTAVVRFIAPCLEAKREFDDDFDSIFNALAESDRPANKALNREIVLIRFLFFFFFVEAVIKTVKGEDEIWLLETGPTRRLYRWAQTI